MKKNSQYHFKWTKYKCIKQAVVIEHLNLKLNDVGIIECYVSF